MTATGTGPSPETLTDEEKLSWLQLARSENVGAVTFHKLIERFSSADAALEALPELSQRGGAGRPPHICPRAKADAEWERAHRLGCRFVASAEATFPRALRWAEGAPPLLAVRGRMDVLQKTSVSIVGSRNASITGLQMARALAAGIADHGNSVTSGLARGIDAEAHRASLGSGTIAVMAGGLDRPYPPQNIPLLEELVDAGAAVSEMPFGWEPRARDFPRRNRIIAGIGLGLVVVEAAKKSGSLISARLAGELGRLVFAVPGSPLDPRARGTNDLIKDGAILTTGAADVLNALEPLAGGSQGELAFVAPRTPAREPSPPATGVAEADRSRIVEALGPAPVEIDEIMRYTNLPLSEVYLVLLELDLAGRLERHPGGLVSVPAAS